MDDCPERPQCGPDEWCWYRWKADLRRDAQATSTIGLYIVLALLDQPMPHGTDVGVVYEMRNEAQEEIRKRFYT